MKSLPVFLRLEGRPVILVGDGDAAAAKRVLLNRAGAIVIDEAGEAPLAIIALEDGAEDVASRIKARGILVNVVDRPDLCDFTLPAIVDRDPVLIAIGTGGASAGLAKALRQRLEDLLPASLGGLADALFAARDAIRRKWPDATARRREIDAALSPNGPLDPLAGGGNVSTWLDQSGDSGEDAREMQTFLIQHDDPDQLTVEQARLLAAADTVYHSPTIAPAILHRARADARRIEWASSQSPKEFGASVYLVRMRKL